MITIKYTYNNGNCIPERELTQDERLTITSELTNGSDMTITYYQGDEPAMEKVDIKIREVANWKLKAILDSMGLIGNVTTALNSLEEPTKTIANYAWEYADTINQYSPTTKLIQQACNLSDEQVEVIFTNAENINI